MPKFLTNPYVLIIIGVLCLILAYQDTNTAMLCDGAPMRPGDTCGDLTYEERQRGEDIVLWSLIGGGLLLILIGGTGISRRSKKKKK